jgi:Icc-related predicted phosphoesterase
MVFSFDLISDLHVESWPNFDWSGQATSPYCVVAGDVARDRSALVETLTHLGECYAGVFYVDGNEEHRFFLNDLKDSYQDLVDKVSQIKNVVFMQNNVVIINNVALLATNGWWTYDFDPGLDPEQCLEWYRDYVSINREGAHAVSDVAYHDAAYLINSVRKLQTHQEVKKIVLITHTLPNSTLIEHDPDLIDHWRFNSMGNSQIQMALNQDTENKIQHWCFGHYHRPVDQEINGVRYVSNPRGRGQTPWSQPAFFPKRIEVKI